MDICVMPHFYAVVEAMVSCGVNTFFLNRVEVPDHVLSPSDLNQLQRKGRAAVLMSQQLPWSNVAHVKGTSNAVNSVGSDAAKGDSSANNAGAGAGAPINLDNMAVGYRYALEFAQQHPGYDCLVIPQAILPDAIGLLGEAFVGTLLKRSSFTCRYIWS
jgi:hypothetical protein